MAGLTQAQVNSDLDFIQKDLAALNATENATIDGTAYACFRRRNLTAEEVTPQGWATKYRFSILVQIADGMAVSVDEVITMETEGAVRVLAVEPGPARAQLILHLGEEYPEETPS